MSYPVNVPQAGDFIGLSQADLLNVNQGVNTASGIDHVDFNAATDAGKHAKTTFVTQGSAPTTGATECALYGATVSAVEEVHYRPQSNGTVFQVTTGGALNLGNATAPMGIRAMGRFTLGSTSPGTLVGPNIGITSVANPSTGVWNLDLTAAALPDANYQIILTYGRQFSFNNGISNFAVNSAISSSTLCVIRTYDGNFSGSNLNDADYICFMVVR